ncbi:MAG: hypothetical protein K6G62_04300 [Eubacterium sp.]|nr:hypothetical protein [Eubacterium sp.]
METYYLIDFENVHNQGLNSIDKLTRTDHVHLFYTDNALNISLDIILTKGVEIVPHKVPVRKQSLDMHLVSFLGYLLGVNRNHKCKFVIVSKDKDYDNVIKFWMSQENFHQIVVRQARIDAEEVNLGISKKKAKQKAKKEEVEKKPLKKKTEKKGLFKKKDKKKQDKEPEKKSVKKTADMDLQSLNTEIQRVLAKAGVDNKEVNRVASIASKFHGKENAKRDVHVALVKEYGQDKGSDFYKQIKSFIKA